MFAVMYCSRLLPVFRAEKPGSPAVPGVPAGFTELVTKVRALKMNVPSVSSLATVHMPLTPNRFVHS